MLEQVAVNITRFHLVGQLSAGAALLGKSLQVIVVYQRRILALLVVGKMSFSAVEIEFTNVRGKYLAIALAAQFVEMKFCSSLRTTAPVPGSRG